MGQHGWVWVRILFQVADDHLLRVLAGWKESELTLWSLLIPFKKPLPSGSNDLPEAYLLVPSHWD